MKKKFLTFILALCLIIPATFMFTACSTTEDDNVQIRVQDGYVQWSSDDSDWKNIITIDEILDAIGENITGPQGEQGQQGIQGPQGEQGLQGEQGVAGKQVEFNVSATHIQWRYVGDATWNNLIALENIKGEKGDDGEDGDNGQDVSMTEYTIIYDYNIDFDVSEIMTNYKTNQTIKSNEWIIGMPYLDNDTDNIFMGWFIQGTNKQIENYDFIGGDVVLEAKWNNYSGIQSISYNADLDGYNCVINNKNLTNINLPDKIIGENGYKNIVKLSGNINGLYENSSLTSIKLPSNLKILGDYLFKGSHIENIEIPQTVEEIGDHTFYGCENLTGITTYATVFKPYAFSGCSQLSNVNLLGNFIKLSENVFSSCAIEEIALDAEEIGKHAFMSNESLTDIILSENLKTLAEEPFLYCSNLNNVYYNGTIDLWATIDFYNQISTPMYYAQHFFIDDTKIINLDLSNVIEINNYAFAYFKDIIEINISNNTTKIGEKAFLNCNSLQKLTLPFIGATLEDETNSSLDYLFGERNVPESLIEFVFNGNKLALNALAFTKIETLNLKGNVTDFNDYGVGSTLKNIYIPNSATSVVDSAFYGNSNLINVYYDGDINDWLALNFTNATSTPMYYAQNLYFKGEEVDEIIIPTDIRKLNNYSLSGFNIKSIEIPANVIDIGEGVFSYSTLESIIIPEQITSIPEFAFVSCESLNTVEFKANTVEISSSAFRNCISLVDINLENVSNIGEFAFSGCEYLSNVILSDYLQVAIGSCAFQSCTSLESIIIYDNIVSIGDNCFNACSENLKIFIEFTSQPESWSANWLSSNATADKIAKHAYWFSENQPTTEGNYWHYDTDEITPIAW